MVSDSIPPKLFRRTYKSSSSLCTHAIHHRDTKDPDNHVKDEIRPATKTHPACTIHEDRMWLPQWLDKKKKKKGKMRKNLTQHGEPQRYSWGMQMMKKKKGETQRCSCGT